MTDTRGAAITLARIDFETDTLSWIGIGNVTADLVAKGPGGVQIRASALLAGGIVGYRIPHALATHQVSIGPGDLLVIVDRRHPRRPRRQASTSPRPRWRSPNTSSMPTAGNPTTRWCSPARHRGISSIDPATAADFHAQYAAALRAYLAAQGEDTLAVGHELGRRALQEQISMLEIVENHSRLVDAPDTPIDTAVALQFLLQTLAALDVVTRGFLDGTKRYEQQRARAEDLADRDEFRTALVNSLQEGFFVADRSGAVIEINDAFADITGYGADGAALRVAAPVDGRRQRGQRAAGRLLAQGTLEAEAPIRHRDGHIVWVAMSVNAVTSPSTDGDVGDTGDTYVGTIRDITAARAAAERDRAVARLATAVSVARSVGEVLSAMLDECRTTLGVRRVAAIIWQAGDHDPTVHLAGTAPATAME